VIIKLSSRAVLGEHARVTINATITSDCEEQPQRRSQRSYHRITCPVCGKPVEHRSPPRRTAAQSAGIGKPVAQVGDHGRRA
jgi:hypothetical protein